MGPRAAVRCALPTGHRGAVAAPAFGQRRADRTPMRIAFLSVSAEMGGSEVSLLELVRGLRRLAPGVEPVVVVPREGPLAARIVAAGGAVRVLPMPAALARFGEWSMRDPSAIARRSGALLNAVGALGPYRRALATLLDDIAPDIIHTNGFKQHVIA